MGDAKKRALSNKQIIQAAKSCVYCSSPPSTIEHMPPRGIFKDRIRPQGLEFAACLACNQTSGAADAVAALVALIDRDETAETWRFQKAVRLIKSLRRRAPGVCDEIFDSNTARSILGRSKAGLIVPLVAANGSGPLLQAYLTVFAAKLGMALYREHVGNNLPQAGGVRVEWYLNSGLTSDTAAAITSILPAYGTLKQGKFSVPDQFAYRYNHDGKGVLAALAGLHGNLHFFVIAASSMDFLNEVPRFHRNILVRPGELPSLIPTAPRAV